jgi:hypothetical protein
MNKRGQGIPVLGVIFGLVVFVILWFMFFAQQVSYWCTATITQNNLTGLEAFFLAYMNVWIFCGVIFGTLAFLYYGGGTR